MVKLGATTTKTRVVRYTFLNDKKEEIETVFKKDVNPPTTVANSLGRLLVDGHFTDVIFHFLGGGELKAHRAVLAARSELVKNMFLDNDKAGNEAITCPIKKDVMSALLHYVYTDNLDATNPNVNDLLAAANYYGFHDLQKELIEHVVQKITCENAISTLIFANENEIDGLKAKALEFIKLNAREVTNEGELFKISENFPESYKNITQVMQLVFNAIAN